jgi:hypothetical protein
MAKHDTIYKDKIHKDKIHKDKIHKDKGNVSSENIKGKDKHDTQVHSLSVSISNIEELVNVYDIHDEYLNERAVLRKIIEHLEDYIKIIVQVLQPEEFHSMHECNAFDDADKKHLFEIYKKTMILHREILKKLIHNDTQAIIATIQHAHEELSGLKPEILRIIDKMQATWKKSYSNGRAGYFG